LNHLQKKLHKPTVYPILYKLIKLTP